MSRDASRIYANAKGSLFQVRILTATGRSQAAAGSGFVVSSDGLAITNYHVVSKLVSDPGRYVAEAVSTAGERDDMTVLKIDVLHDLALIRINRTVIGAAADQLQVSEAGGASLFASAPALISGSPSRKVV